MTCGSADLGTIGGGAVSAPPPPVVFCLAEWGPRPDPAWQRTLTSIAGRNIYGDPMLRLIHGSGRLELMGGIWSNIDEDDYGLPALRVDGNDFLAVHAATAWAAERARTNQGATVIELFTYRAAQHSTSDDPSRYRPADEWEHWPLGDPIARLKQHLIAIGEWSDEQQVEAEKDAVEQVRAAGKESEAIGTLGQSRPSVKTMFEEVYATEDWRLIEQRREVGV